MAVEKQRETSPKFREIDRVSKQVKEELKRFNKEKFYEKDGEEIVYNMDTVKQYLLVLKDKKTWKELISKNSSAMVMAVQIALYSQNYSFWSIDWILGDKTKAAIRKFQADNNLPVDTFWRSMPSTIQKLLEVISREDQIEIPEEEKQEAEEIMEEKENKDNSDDKQDGDVSMEIVEQWNKQPEDELKQDELELDNGINFDNQDKIDGNITGLDQNIIRPEVEEMINNLMRNSDKIKELTTITYAEAVAISEKWWYYIELTWVKEIAPETFEALLKFKWWISIWIENLTLELAKKLEESWKWISFSWLEKIDNIEIYKTLWKTKWTLRFNKIKNITPEEMWELVKKPWWDIYLDWMEEISPEIAEKIVEYPRDILLDWVKRISKKTAEILSNKNKWKVYLRWLETPIDNDVMENLSKMSAQNLVTNHNTIFQMYNYKKEKEREWKNLSQNVLDILDSKVSKSELSKLDYITKDDAEFLAKSWLHYIDLPWVKEITPETFEALLKFKWWISIWIENLTLELAKKLEESWKWISFSWLEKIDNIEIYKTLWKTKWTLRFNKIKNITPEEMWELVKKPWWDIYLDWMEEISPEIAEKIVWYQWDILLDWVKKMDKKTAKKLAEMFENLPNKNLLQWRIYLRWLETPLNEEVLEELSKIPSQRLKVNTDVMSQIYRYKKEKEEETENN